MEGSSSEEILNGGDAAAGSGTVGEDAISDGKERVRRGGKKTEIAVETARRVSYSLWRTLLFFVYVYGDGIFL